MSNILVRLEKVPDTELGEWNGHAQFAKSENEKSKESELWKVCLRVCTSLRLYKQWKSCFAHPSDVFALLLSMPLLTLLIAWLVRWAQEFALGNFYEAQEMVKAACRRLFSKVLTAHFVVIEDVCKNKQMLFTVANINVYIFYSAVQTVQIQEYMLMHWHYVCV